MSGRKPSEVETGVQRSQARTQSNSRKESKTVINFEVTLNHGNGVGHLPLRLGGVATNLTSLEYRLMSVIGLVMRGSGVIALH